MVQMPPHAFAVGELVKYGTGPDTWRISGFFGEHADVADLTRIDNHGRTTLARFENLRKVAS